MGVTAKPQPPRKPALTDADFASAARTLRVSVPAIKAVAQVESPRGGFLPDGRPTLLFEAHIFGRLTGHRYNRSHPGISSRRGNSHL